MTVLQRSGTDEGTNPPPTKKRCLSFSRNKAEINSRFVKTWLKNLNSESCEESHPMPAATNTMLNGYETSDTYSQTHHIQRSPEENGYSDSVVPVIPLSNMGNTCFLNGVLYTLRFAPSFLHKLHHLDSDVSAFIKQFNASKQSDKNYSSLGRNMSKSGSWSGKDTLPCGLEIKAQSVSKLHQLYTMLCTNEMKDRMDPFQPNFFFEALREVNPMFLGNHQHDAHELLVCVLDIIREVCEVVYQEDSNSIERPPPPCPTRSNNSIIQSMKQKSLKFIKKGTPRGNNSDGDIKKYLMNGDTVDKEDDGSYVDDHCRMSHNTIFEDFRGVSLLRTTCLECEHVTERKETFCDICVPIETVVDCENEASVEKLYQSIIVTEEYLIDCNKYWCEKCSRYNEARRCVKYEKLPRLLTLHLKRFTSNFGTSVAKVNDHMPTPFTLSCLCEECLSVEPAERPHYYNLYAIIMHVGETISSGHYVSFVKALDNTTEYLNCKRDKPKTSSLSRSGSNASSINTSSSKQSNSFSRFFLPKLSSKSFNGNSLNPKSWNPNESRERVTYTCRGMECCTIRFQGLPTFAQDSNAVWLQCDDDKVRAISAQELADMMSLAGSKVSQLTPYLLFYAREDS